MFRSNLRGFIPFTRFKCRVRCHTYKGLRICAKNSYKTCPTPLLWALNSSGDILACMDNPPPDGLAIPDEKKGHSDWHERLSTSFAYGSLACSLSLWAALALYHLQTALHFSLLGWKWFDSLPVWTWPLLELFALVLAITAAILHVHAKLWRIALPLSVLMFLLTMYIMGS